MSNSITLAHYKRIVRAMQDELKELRENDQSLELLKSNPHIFDAVFYYMTMPHLKPNEVDGLRECLTILARGGGQ